MPEPPGSSWPDQVTVRSVSVVVAGRGSTWLVGAAASRVLKTSGVSIGSLKSKKMRARFSMTVPEGRPASGRDAVADRALAAAGGVVGVEQAEERVLGEPAGGGVDGLGA